MPDVRIDGESLTIDDVVKVARGNARVVIPEQSKTRVTRSRGVLEKLVRGNHVVYGVNTGFGELSNFRVQPDEIKQLQVNLIRSHSAGVGKPLETDVVRAIMLLRANTLAKGHSGVRLETLERLVEMLNKRVHPVIPSRGSVGASGDLAPLSHMILVLIGEGQAEYRGRIVEGKKAMKEAEIQPVELEFKEGLAMNNGTQMMTALAALTVHDAKRLVEMAEAAAALSVEALLGIVDAFNPRIHEVRPHAGQTASARNMREMLEGSRLVRTGAQAMDQHQRPHDPYSLRCVPQVLGVARDAIAYVEKVVQVEINSATDNPLVFPEEEKCLSGGNFHGQPLSFAMDMLGIALATVANNSERRTARLIDDKLSNGLPPFLIPPQAKTGVNSGLMAVQYTAAALASENKVLAHPASVDSIPTSADFEDFVSMGAAAAHKAMQILENTEYIVAVELLCAAQAVEYRGPEKLGKGTRAVYDSVRTVVSALKEDKQLSGEIEKIRDMIRKDKPLQA